MQINNEQRFNYAPTINAPRSTFLMHQNIRTTFNAGSLIPLSVDTDIMPGDTFKIHGTVVCRETTSLHPTMDNAFLELFGIFVPHRLGWTHWQEFWGENTTGSWVQTTAYSIPQIIIAKTSVSDAVSKGDALQYMGIPILSQTSDGISINALAWRAYAITWNELFRDENVAAPIYVYKGDKDTIIDANSSNTWGNYTDNSSSTNPSLPNTCAPVYKYKDYFNAGLPEPQKGNPITLPIGQNAPLYIHGDGKAIGLIGSDGVTAEGWVAGLESGASNNLQGNTTAYGKNVGDPTTVGTNAFTGAVVGLTKDPTKSGIVGWADLANAVAATINAQRFAFAAQRILEAQARVGTRYWEILEGIFKVSNPSAARLQRPELIFHRKIPLSMTQVPQTSSTDNTSAQGNVAAYSLTADSTHLATKSFTEHGTLLILACVRQEHSYDTGIARQWLRTEKLDFYHPQMAFLGEQAIYNMEIYAQGNSYDKQTFAFNERWAELRYKQNINTGAFSTKYAQTLASWHYGDAYNNLPILSDAWRRETPDFIDRTLVVAHTTEDQFILDSRWEYVATRSIPMYSIPGLLDHF